MVRHASKLPGTTPDGKFQEPFLAPCFQHDSVWPKANGPEMKELFDRYTSFHRIGPDGTVYATQTKLVRVGERINRDLPSELDGLGDRVDRRRVAVVMDDNTRRAAGQDLLDVLARARWNVEAIVLQPRSDESAIVCDDARIDEVQGLLADGGFTHAISVGAGTINDLVKMATFRLGYDYTSVGTAPSMNGYTSSISAILSNGVKITQPCHAPVAVFSDPEVMAHAPYRMIASGIGDLYSKPVSNADWRLSHRLLGTGHSDIVMELVDAGAKLLEGVAPHLPSRDPSAVANLTGALMLSGLAMQAAGNSGPASGGEHLISHYVDMTSIAHDLPHDFHGCQVAVGTVTTSHLYEAVRALDPRALNVEHLAADHLEWSDYEVVLRKRFGALSDAVLKHAKKLYPSQAQVHQRLRTLTENWDDIFADVATTLRPSAELRLSSTAPQCPTAFPQIGVAQDRALDSVRYSKDIRARYTILHLASELGVLDDMAERWVGAQFVGSERGSEWRVASSEGRGARGVT